jgi:hypothetical protein
VIISTFRENKCEKSRNLCFLLKISNLLAIQEGVNGSGCIASKSNIALQLYREQFPVGLATQVLRGHPIS